MGLRKVMGLPTLAALVLAISWAGSMPTEADEMSSIFIEGDSATREMLLDHAAGRPFVLVGEIHPAGSHHAFQASVIEGLAQRGRKPTIVLEMVPASVDPVLARWIAGEIASADLDAALDWKKRGWPEFELYRPIFEAAKAAGLPMVGAAVERDEVMKLAMKAEAEITTDLRSRYMLDDPLAPSAETTLRKTIVDSHCGMIDEAGAGPMMLAQRIRDGAMARAMVDAGEEGAVLIAGNGHVRRDHGVPRLLPEGEAFAIGQIETRAPDADRADSFDALHLTGSVDRGDPCAEIKTRMNSKGSKRPEGN